MSEPLRVGVIGGGMIAQTVHLPTLACMPKLFRTLALAEPSRTVRESLERRYPGLTAYADWRALVESDTIDALVVGSPNATHVDIVLAALDRGVHVFVEKPLALDPADIDLIIRRRDAASRVVQVGYQKRYDAGYTMLLKALPASAVDLRLIDVLTYDPGMARPPFTRADLIIGRDVDPDTIRDTAASEAEQVSAALGRSVEATATRAYVDVFLGALIHDVNLVHGVLERLDIPIPLTVSSAGWWADGKAADVLFEAPGGVAWHSSWLLLEGLEDFRETMSLYFANSVHRLTFSSPYLREHATVHELFDADGGGERANRTSRILDSYRAELEHFHACITRGTPCHTPAEQARSDITALRDAFRLTLN